MIPRFVLGNPFGAEGQSYHTSVPQGHPQPWKTCAINGTLVEPTTDTTLPASRSFDFLHYTRLGDRCRAILSVRARRAEAAQPRGGKPALPRKPGADSRPAFATEIENASSGSGAFRSSPRNCLLVPAPDVARPVRLRGAGLTPPARPACLHQSAGVLSSSTRGLHGSRVSSTRCV